MYYTNKSVGQYRSLKQKRGKPEKKENVLTMTNWIFDHQHSLLS
jgi:hypothetical protein